LVDPDEQFIYCNPVAEEVYGVPSGTLVGRNLRDFVSSETFELIRRQTEKRRAGERSTYEFEIIRPDGEKRQLLITVTPWLDEDRQFAGALGVFRDITDRKRLEKESEERRLYLESVLACAPDAIVTVDDEHKILEWNEGAERLFGYSAKEVAGRDLDELVTGTDAGTHEEATGYTQYVLGGEVLPPTEAMRYRKDGTPVDVILAGAPIRLGEEMIGAVGVYADITERKRAEEALRDSEERFGVLFEYAPDAYYLSDLKGTFVDGNEAAEALVGYSRAEIIGMSFLKL